MQAEAISELQMGSHSLQCLFIPHLSYATACSVSAASGKSEYKAIDTLQHRALKIMLKLCTHTPSIALVLKIADIRDYQHLVYLYKILLNFADDRFGEYLTLEVNSSQRSIRNKDELYLQLFRLAISQLTFSYTTLKLSNDLPTSIKNKNLYNH